MKLLINRLEKGLMFVLCFMPLVSLFARLVETDVAFAPVWLAAQSFVAAIIALLPAYVGNYTETEVVRYIGAGSHGNDPVPDREAYHEVIKSGHRFPIRISVDIIFLMLDLCAMLFVPSSCFIDGKILHRAAFAVGMLVLEFMVMYSVATTYCVWTELPGIIFGFFSYFCAALFLNFSKQDNARLNLIIGICALAFIFFGGICLNRQSLNISAGSVDHKAPRGLVRRNRRIVIGFTVFTGVVSFVEPVRKAAVWCLDKIWWVLKKIAWLLRGCKDAEEGNLDALLAGQEDAEYVAEEATELTYEATKDTFANILTVAFLVFVALGGLWLLFDRLFKLARKLSQWLEKFAAGVSEGYYDEKRNLEEEEPGKKLRAQMKDRLKKLFTRETPWDKLSGRDKARRLVKELYKKRGARVNRLFSRTAREALARMELKNDTDTRAADAYEKARYSSHDIDSDNMDKLRKEIRP